MLHGSLLAAAVWAVATAPWLASAECPEGCPRRCPTQAEVQSDFVRSNFDIAKFWGTFYEIAFHDSTQPSAWPIKAACQRSVKSQHPGDPKNYKDLFSLNEGPGKGLNVVCDLEFNITDKPGVFKGHWSGHSIFNPNLTDIDNTVVDVGLAANGTYNWTLEFQCKEYDDPSIGIRFAALNFYHKKPVIDQWELDLMMDRLRARGLGWIAETTPGLTMVDQQKCIDKGSYPALDAKPYLCGQKAVQEQKQKQNLIQVESGNFTCPGFLKPICDIASSVQCVASCVPLLSECIQDTACVANLKDMGLCMAEMKRKNASADETQACLVPDNKKRSNFVYCLMDDPGCVKVPVPPSTYPECQDEQIAGDSSFNIPNVFGDWFKVKGWKKGEIVECLPCQQVKFWRYDPATPLPWPSPKPPAHTEDMYSVISSSWQEADSKGKLWPMNQTSLWGPRPGRQGFPAKEYSLGIMFGIGYKEKYTVVHDGSSDSEPFLVLYACGVTKQGEYVSGLVLAKTPTISAALQDKVANILTASGFDAADWCDVDNSCAEPSEVSLII
mmetsp:Transcript_11236/g.39854  ORF Transcript_11236/g.39854 Transcript_11236/m.39854 type:complete len:554 (-) Transcript_11236:143-1804(-)